MRALGIISILTLFLCSSCFFKSLPNKDENKETVMLIKTDKGDIKIKLYNETPLHRDNFIKLVKENFYEGVLFHRVINNFMIQTGDPDSKTANQGQMLGNGGPGYTIPAEFNSKFIHKKGALAAARQGDQTNPKKESSGSQFYIVHGNKLTDEQLTRFEQGQNQQKQGQFFMEFINKPENQEFKAKIETLQKEQKFKELNDLIENDTTFKTEMEKLDLFKFTDEQKEMYKTAGGAPHLDGGYTVFGEVIEGLGIIDTIATVEVDRTSRPLEDVKILSIKEIK